MGNPIKYETEHMNDLFNKIGKGLSYVNSIRKVSVSFLYLDTVKH